MMFVRTDDPAPLLAAAESLGIDPRTVKPATVHGYMVDDRVYAALSAAPEQKRRGRKPAARDEVQHTNPPEVDDA